MILLSATCLSPACLPGSVPLAFLLFLPSFLPSLHPLSFNTSIQYQYLLSSDHIPEVILGSRREVLI